MTNRAPRFAVAVTASAGEDYRGDGPNVLACRVQGVVASLRAASYSGDVVCLVAGFQQLPSELGILQAACTHIVEPPAVTFNVSGRGGVPPPPYSNVQWRRADYARTSLKLNVWWLTQYDLILHTDADVVFAENPMPAFEQAFAHGRIFQASEELWERKYRGINSHLMLLRPNELVGAVAAANAASGHFVLYTLGEQDVVESMLTRRVSTSWPHYTKVDVRFPANLHNANKSRWASAVRERGGKLSSRCQALLDPSHKRFEPWPRCCGWPCLKTASCVRRGRGAGALQWLIGGDEFDPVAERLYEELGTEVRSELDCHTHVQVLFGTTHGTCVWRHGKCQLRNDTSSCAADAKSPEAWLLPPAAAASSGNAARAAPVRASKARFAVVIAVPADLVTGPEAPLPMDVQVRMARRLIGSLRRAQWMGDVVCLLHGASDGGELRDICSIVERPRPVSFDPGPGGARAIPWARSQQRVPPPSRSRVSQWPDGEGKNRHANSLGLAAWGLVQYDYVLYAALDVVFIESPADAFAQAAAERLVFKAEASSEGRGYPGVSVHLMLLRPDADLHAALAANAMTGNFVSFRLNEQDVIESFFPPLGVGTSAKPYSTPLVSLPRHVRRTAAPKAHGSE